MADDTDTVLAEAFAEVARTLLAESTVERTLKKITDLAAETIDGCDHAGISLVQGRAVVTPASTDAVPASIDAIQHEVGEGPCLDAIRDHEVYQSDQLADEQRWPAFARRAAAQTGVASVLSFRLFTEGDTLGALNLYSRTPAAFGEEDRHIGAVFAAHAAVALRSAQREENLEEALGSRDVIGQAKGILMARQGVSSDEAFELLRRASQRLNVKLRDVAQRVADTGTAPSGP